MRFLMEALGVEPVDPVGGRWSDVLDPVPEFRHGDTPPSRAWRLRECRENGSLSPNRSTLICARLPGVITGVYLSILPAVGDPVR